MLRRNRIFAFLAKPKASVEARGNARLGKERMASKMDRIIAAERARDAERRNLTWKDRLDKFRNFPWKQMVVFMTVWTIIGFRGVFPWRGFAAGEYPPNMDKFPAEIKDKVSRVPHWVPLPEKKA